MAKPEPTKVKKHKFNGKIYKIKWRKPYKCEGLCDDPASPASDRYIWLNPHSSEEDLILLATHEAIHSCMFFLDEETVTKAGDDIGSFLYKMGFRLQDNTNKSKITKLSPKYKKKSPRQAKRK